MRPEDSAQFWQEVAARYDLAQDVAEGTRKSFDDLKAILAYGVLCYEIFTLVPDHGLLVFEQALSLRLNLRVLVRLSS